MTVPTTDGDGLMYIETPGEVVLSVEPGANSTAVEAFEVAVKSTQLSQQSRNVVRPKSAINVVGHSNGFLRLLLEGVDNHTEAVTCLVALAALTGSYYAKSVAKSKHRKCQLSCFMYRKVKELAKTQPWFCLPLISFPLLSLTFVNIRPPKLAYGLLVGGWVLNWTSHIAEMMTRSPTFTRQVIPISYWCWLSGNVIGVFGVVANLLSYRYPL